MRFTQSYVLAALSALVLAAPQVTLTSFSTAIIPAPTVAPKAAPPPLAPPVVSPIVVAPIPPKVAPPPAAPPVAAPPVASPHAVVPPVVAPAPPKPVTSAPNAAPPALPTVLTSFTLAPLPTAAAPPAQWTGTAIVPSPKASGGFGGFLPKISSLPRPSGGLLGGLRPSSVPKAAPPPKAPAGASTLCGANQSPCPSGQYCYDANQDRVVTASDANALGTCYGGACGASTSCPVGQVCMEGMCLNRNLDCGFLGDECPEGPGWRCVGAGPFERGRGYCGYSPKFVSF